MCKMRTNMSIGRVLIVASVVGVLTVAWTAGARAQNCTSLLSLFQQGLSDADIAQAAGWHTNSVAACRRDLQRPIVVGPSGAPPVGAAGPAPGNAAGPPPRGAAGPPPIGAAGPPPVGREVKRLP
jgi:hypothetical protein